MLNDILYIGGVRVVLPRPFEVGTIFGSFPVAMYDYIKDGDGSQLSKKVQFAFLNTFAMNPIPQAVKPTGEVLFNYDTFRGMPINDMSDMNLPADMRYDERTTEAAKAAGKIVGMSPKNIDHLVRGHLGSMGIGLLAGIDTVMAGMGVIPKQADGLFGDPYHIGDMVASASGMERFFKDADVAASRFVGDFYEVKREADQANRAYKKLLAEQKDEEAAEFLAEMKAPMSARKELGRIGREIGKLNKQRDAIFTDPKMMPAEKKLKLKALTLQRKALAKKGYMYAKGFQAVPTVEVEEEAEE